MHLIDKHVHVFTLRICTFNADSVQTKFRRSLDCLLLGAVGLPLHTKLVLEH